MDCAEEINKPKSIHATRKYNSKIITNSCYRGDQDDTEDRRLKNWKKWLDNREKTCNRLKNLTGRKSADLLINSYEKIRPKIAIQNLIEAASFTELSEECKNDLNFWTIPEYLKNRRDPDNPELAVSLTKKQLRIPRILSRVFLPELSQEEKSLELPEAPGLSHRHDEYLRKKLKELSPQISKLNLKTRGIHEVAVRGRKIPEREQIIFRFDDKEIIIDEDEIYMRNNVAERRIFGLSFFAKKEETAEQKVCLENKTLLKITYEWQEIVCDPFELSKLNKSRCFYIDKSSNTILPGRCDDLIIWYHPAGSGGHLESMRLDADPRITIFPIVFNFWGICQQPIGFIDDLIEYEDYLEVCLRNCLINEIIEDIWERVELPAPELPPYALYFRETEVFLCKNRYFLYHHEVVKELKEIYEKITKRDSWALSLAELQGHLLQIYDEDFRSQMMNKFVESCRKLLKPSHNALLITDKFEIVYNLISGFIGKFSIVSESIKEHCRRDKFETEEFRGSVSGSGSDLSGFYSTRSTEMRKNLRKDREWKRQCFLHGSASYLDSGFKEFYRDTDTIYDIELYFEIFYVKIYHLLGNTIEEICSSLDSINNLN